MLIAQPLLNAHYPHCYMWGSITFQEKEIPQIVHLMRLYCAGSSERIDARRYTKQVQQYSVAIGLLEKKGNMLVIGRGRINPVHDLPPAVQAAIVLPMIPEKSIGRSIAKHVDWRYALNIWEMGSHHFSDRSMEQIMDVLSNLAAYRYLIAQFGGEIWWIEKLEGGK